MSDVDISSLTYRELNVYIFSIFLKKHLCLHCLYCNITQWYQAPSGRDKVIKFQFIYLFIFV